MRALLTAGLAACAMAVDIFEAVKADDSSAIAAALELEPASLNLQGDGGQTPLMYGVLNGKEQAVRHLLSVGADTSIPENDGYTPMHGAAFRGRAAIAKMLIEHGLNPSDRHTDGYTPLHRACWGRQIGHAETVRVLLAAGVPPGEITPAGKICLEMTKNARSRMHLIEYTKLLKLARNRAIRARAGGQRAPPPSVPKIAANQQGGAPEKSSIAGAQQHDEL